MKQLIQTTLQEGGLVLGALLVLAAMIYALVADLWVGCGKAKRRIEAAPWHEDRADGEPLSESELRRNFAGFELKELARIERRLPFLGVLIGAAPLLGLLGTVAGMLITFGGIANVSGIAPIDTVSTGISRALVTTQAGLVVAVPAAFLMAMLKRKATLVHGELERQLHHELAQRGGRKR